MKAVFLDRDGIINKERGDYTWRKEDFVFTDGLFDALKYFRNEGYELIVITNQGGIDKGLYSKKEVEDLHHWMKESLQHEGISLKDVFYCPHHSEIQKCLCRKPASVLFEKALAIYGIDAKASVMIGDRKRDFDAAVNAGIRGVVIDSNPDWAKLDLKALLTS